MLQGPKHDDPDAARVADRYPTLAPATLAAVLDRGPGRSPAVPTGLFRPLESQKQQSGTTLAECLTCCGMPTILSVL